MNKELKRRAEELNADFHQLESIEQELMTEIAAAANIDEPGFALVLGEWICKGSPAGYCVFNRFDDRARDHCLFCGYPDERK